MPAQQCGGPGTGTAAPDDIDSARVNRPPARGYAIPGAIDSADTARLRGELASLHVGVKVALLEAVAAAYIAAPDATLDRAADMLLAAMAPALAEIRHQCLVAILHMDQMAERAQRKGNAAERAVEHAERLVTRSLAGLQVTALTAEVMPSGQNRWRPDGETAGAFDPAGYFVYCLWGEDPGRPIYVGESANILARLGQHATGKRGQIRRVTLLRCRTERQMHDTESRMIGHYQPPLNIRGIQPSAERASWG